MPIDYSQARALLERAIENAERTVIANAKAATPPQQVLDSIEFVFTSKTQAFREVLLGCLLVRILDNTTDITKPYVSQGTAAYNGRTLDERTVNPLLQEKRIPASRRPFLSVFRRSVEFNASTREEVRDKSAYDAFMSIIEYASNTSDEATLLVLLNHISYRFVLLREAANVPVTRIQRMSLDQIHSLISNLLGVASGGRFAVYVVISGIYIQFYPSRYESSSFCGSLGRDRTTALTTFSKVSGIGGTTLGGRPTGFFSSCSAIVDPPQ